MIKSITRGHIDIEINGKLARIYGEVYIRGRGSPDFVIYANSLIKWEPPHDSEPLGQAERAAVVMQTAEEMRLRGMTVEIEQ
jgi:hypothetical protein